MSQFVSGSASLFISRCFRNPQLLVGLPGQQGLTILVAFLYLDIGHGCFHVRLLEEAPEEICPFCNKKMGIDIMGMGCDHWN